MALSSPTAARQKRLLDREYTSAKQRWPAVRDQVEKEMTDPHKPRLEGGVRGFMQFKHAHQDLSFSEMTANDWRSTVQSCKIGLGEVNHKKKPAIIFNNRCQSAQKEANKKRVVYDTEEFRQIGKLVMQWLNDGANHGPGEDALTKLLAQSAYLANEVAAKDISDAHKQLRQMRCKAWVGQFKQKNGLLPQYVDYLEPIEVPSEQFWYELVAEANERPGSMGPSKTLANSVLALVDNIDIAVLVVPEGGQGMQYLLDQLVHTDHLKPGAHFYHASLCAVFLRFDAQTEHFRTTLENCLCNTAQQHQEVGAEAAVSCPSWSCNQVIHHYCAEGMGPALLKLGFSIAVANLIMNQAKYFLNWNAVQALLMNESDAMTILRIVGCLDLDQSDNIGDELLQLVKYLAPRRWQWGVYYQKRTKFQGMQLSTLVSFARLTCYITKDALLVDEMEAGIDTVVQRKAKDNRHTSVLTHDQIIKMYTHCEKLAVAAKSQDLFEKVFKVMKGLHGTNGVRMKPYATQAWAVTRLLQAVTTGKKKYAFLSMAPGSGKTYVVLLLMQVLEGGALGEGMPKQACYVVPTEWLQKAAFRIAKEGFSFGQKPNIILPHQMRDLMKKEVLMIVDEAVTTLKTAEVVYRHPAGKASMGGLLALGYTPQPAIFLNGFAMPNTKKFFRRNYQDCTVIEMGRQLDYVNPAAQQKAIYTIVCQSSYDDLVLKLYE